MLWGGVGTGRRPGGGAADAGGARGFRRSRNGLRPGAGVDFFGGFGGEGLVRAAGPAAEPPTRAKPAGFGEAETACGRGLGFDFLGGFFLGGGEGRRPGGGAADAGEARGFRRSRNGLRPDPGGCEKTALTGGRSGRGLRLGVRPWGGDVFAEDGV